MSRWLLATALVAVAASACSGTSAPPSAQQTTTISTPASPTGVSLTASAKPLGVPTGTTVPTFAPATSTTANRQPVRVAGHTDAGLGGNDTALINLVYTAYLSDLSGLLDYLTRDWLSAVGETATEHMTTAAAGAAASVQQAHDHGIGTLVDSHRKLTITGTTASLTDCLDEKSWYVVENASGQPDPSVTRDFFVGTATFSKVQKQWKVSSWNSHPQRCSF